MRKLGDDDFAVRSQAAEKLLELGKAGEEAVRRGVTDRDPEVRNQCRQLLPRIRASAREARLKAFLADTAGKGKHDLPGWAPFARAAGSDAAARQLFVRALRADERLLAAAERDPRAAAAEAATRCARLRLRLISPGADRTALAEPTALLLVAADSRVPLAPGSREQLRAGLETLSHRAALVKQLHDSAPARKLLSAPARPARRFATPRST